MDDYKARMTVLAVAISVCASAAIVATVDKRSVRAPPSGMKCTFAATTFEQAMRASKTDWFHKKLRSHKTSFLHIYKEVGAASERLPAANCKTPLIKRVALTINYLAVSGTMDQAASGISRPRAVVYIHDTLRVLAKMSKRYVTMPAVEELYAVEQGFESIAGFPGVVGAIDGTLIKIPRPRDFEGWYCRKGFPAVNAQAIVGHRGAFRSLSIRAGSNNDQSLWNGSGVRKRQASTGDAGYKLWGQLLTPFPEKDAAADQRMRTDNYRHSRSRITVECAFGRLKNRFRILLGKLEQKSSKTISDVIVGCVVLHNLLLTMGDSYQVSPNDPLRQQPRARALEELTNPEQPLSREQGIMKCSDIADIFAGLF